jgi:hypothetical protein
MRFSRGDAGVIRKYRLLRKLVWDVLRAVGEELQEYGLEWDGVNYEQGDYFFLRFLAGNQEVSPGIKVSERSIIRPVCWVRKDPRCAELDFKPDPEFKGYLIREMPLEEGFFKLSYEEQKEEILGFFRAVVEELVQAGVIRGRGYYIAG